MTVTERISNFISSCSYQDLPSEAIDMAKSAIMDYVGVTIAGFSEKSSRIVCRIINRLGGNPQATIWGSGLKTSVSLAALANGTAAHALDYDDTNPAIMGHPSVQLFPGLFALAEYKEKTGSQLILGYVSGFEIGVRLGKALNPELVYQGWFPVGTLGVLMQTAGCAKLLDLDRDQTSMAIGIASNLASGLRCNNGTMAKSLLAGQVGSNGILAALLAREGMTADRNALEDRFGFFENFSKGDRAKLKNAIEGLGNHFNMIESGISYKIYPSCAGTHMPIDCALEISRRYKPVAEDIKEIQVSLGSYAKYLLIHPRPTTEIEAKFSLEYCVARALLDGEMGLEQFSSEKIQDRYVRALIEKIHSNYYDKPGVEEGKRPPVEMNVHMKDGRIYSFRVEAAKGTSSNPLTKDELKEKFTRCCKDKLDENRITLLGEKLGNLEQISNVAELITLLV